MYTISFKTMNRPIFRNVSRLDQLLDGMGLTAGTGVATVTFGSVLTLNATFDQVLNLCIPYKTRSYDLTTGSYSNKTFSRNGSMDADSGLLTLNTTFDEVETDFIEDNQICSIGYIGYTGSCSD